MIETYVERHGRFPPETRHSWGWSHLAELRTRYGLPDEAPSLKAVKKPGTSRRQMSLL
jgi:hypothetical protein